MSFKFGVAVCTLNQLALDFTGNATRIKQSIDDAFKQNALIRIGPELEICGYSCEDAFFEEDTTHHSWQVLELILKDCSYVNNMIIDLGMPITFNGSLYNCRVLLYQGKILAIRAKTRLANDGNYRESRWFTAWTNSKECVWFPLPSRISNLTKQKYVPFGANFVLEISLRNENLTDCDFLPVGTCSSFRIGFEICEELWQPSPEHVKLFTERGCHLVCNSSASYWQIRKLSRIRTLIQSATQKCGGAYAYSNMLGCDGSRLCFYGRSLVMCNGQLNIQCTDENSLFKEVQVNTSWIDINDIISYRHRNNIKVNLNSSTSHVIDFSSTAFDANNSQYASLRNLVIVIPYSKWNMSNFSETLNNFFEKKTDNEITAEKEIQFYASLWLWDYLRKSKFARGFIIPLSGGLDSCSVALIVFSMCNLVVKYSKLPEVKDAIDHIHKTHNLEVDITTAQSICSLLLRCVYLKTKFSGIQSETRARQLAKILGAEFDVIDFTTVYENLSELGSSAFQKSSSKSNQISGSENVTIRFQNLQARIRMLLTYHMSEGTRIVLATGNVDEALVGYLTKYDCSSADLNPIGSIAKQDLRKFIAHINSDLLEHDTEIITSILQATPSAELSGVDQEDEKEIGLTYKELSLFGSLRKGDLGCCGPYGMFCKLLAERMNSSFSPDVPIEQDAKILASKVKRFFTLHARNRHKQTILTPSLHAVTYSPDDNRYDHRQFLYNTDWSWQFKCIDKLADTIN